MRFSYSWRGRFVLAIPSLLHAALDHRHAPGHHWHAPDSERGECAYSIRQAHAFGCTDEGLADDRPVLNDGRGLLFHDGYDTAEHVFHQRQ